MNFDPLSFVIGKHGDSGPVRDAASYLLGRAVGAPGEIWETLTNVPIASFTAVSAALRELVISIDPVQSGSGDPSPDNVRPISGWTGANLHITRSNLYDGTKNNGYINDRGVIVPSDAFCHSDYIPVVSGYAMWSGVSGQSNTKRLHCYDADKNWISNPYTSISVPANQSYSLGGSMPNGTAFIRLSFVVSDTYLMVSSVPDASYEPYGTTISVSWHSEAGTVYAATLDALAGKLKVRPYYASYNGETLVGPWISDRDVYAAGATPTIGAQVVDLGGTETEYTIDPVILSTLLGVNNIWANTGSINTITFRTH